MVTMLMSSQYQSFDHESINPTAFEAKMHWIGSSHHQIPVSVSPMAWVLAGLKECHIYKAIANRFSQVVS